MLPYYTERQPNHKLMYTVDHTFVYHSKKFICTCAKLAAHAHGTEIRGNLKLFKNLRRTRKIMDGSPLTHNVAYGCVNTDDTACIVKGVLENIISQSQLFFQECLSLVSQVILMIHG